MDDVILQEQYWFWSIAVSALSLFVSGAISIFIFIISNRINKSIKIMEINSKSTERIADLRAKLYGSVKSDINLIFTSCYMVGDWRKTKISEIIRAKRAADKAIIEALPVWGSEVVQAYVELMDVSFQTKSGRNTSPKLRADPQRYQCEHESLPSDWEKSFMEVEERQAWIVERLGNKSETSYRTNLLKPAFVRFNVAVAESMGVELSEKQVFDLL